MTDKNELQTASAVGERTPAQIYVQRQINQFWCLGFDNKSIALEPEADALIANLDKVRGIPPFEEMVSYEDRILEVEMRCERLKRLVRQPENRGGYKGDTFYPVGGAEASHEWDGERWNWLPDFAQDTPL